MDRALAETEGFEPSIPFWGYAHLANECLQPLGHVSGSRFLTFSSGGGQRGRSGRGLEGSGRPLAESASGDHGTRVEIGLDLALELRSASG